MVIIQFTRFHRQPGEQRQGRQQQPSPSHLPQVNWSPHLVLPDAKYSRNPSNTVNVISNIGRETTYSGLRLSVYE